MTDQSKLCCVGFHQLAIKKNSFNSELDEVEYFGDVEQSKYSGYRSVVFMLRGLVCKWKKPIGYFPTNSTASPNLLKNILLKCIQIASECNVIVKGIFNNYKTKCTC